MCDQAGLAAWCPPQPCNCPILPKVAEDFICPSKPLGEDSNSLLNKNIAEAKKHYDPTWFYNQVRNKSPWDYKQKNSLYANFGNYNYGATGYAMGFPEAVLLRMAGWAQTQAGFSEHNFGKPYDLSSMSSYGDDPNDQIQIKKGIDYVRCGCGK